MAEQNTVENISNVYIQWMLTSECKYQKIKKLFLNEIRLCVCTCVCVSVVEVESVNDGWIGFEMWKWEGDVALFNIRQIKSVIVNDN